VARRQHCRISTIASGFRQRLCCEAMLPGAKSTVSDPLRISPAPQVAAHTLTAGWPGPAIVGEAVIQLVTLRDAYDNEIPCDHPLAAAATWEVVLSPGLSSPRTRTPFERVVRLSCMFCAGGRASLPACISAPFPSTHPGQCIHRSNRSVLTMRARLPST